jgi:hypothetical protein
MQMDTIFFKNERHTHTLQVRVCIHSNRLQKGRSIKDSVRRPKAAKAEQDCNGFCPVVILAAFAADDSDVKTDRSLKEENTIRRSLRK